jgi:hypothetical protein
VVTLGTPTNAARSKQAVHRLAILDDDDDPDPLSEWSDNFYLFRVPITVNVPSPGEYTLDLTNDTITDWVNEAADFDFNPMYFDYDSIKLVEVDSQGDVINDDVDAGYYIRIGNEQLINGDFENGENGWMFPETEHPPAFVRAQTSYDGSWCMSVTADTVSTWCGQPITTNLYTWYKFSTMAKGFASVSPEVWSNTLSNFLSVGFSANGATYDDPYQPKDGWHKREYFFYTDDKSDWTLDIWARIQSYETSAVDDVSIKECEVAFVLNADSAGTKQYMLYYTPIEGRTPYAPTRERQTAFPGTTLAVTKDDATNRLNEGVTYKLASTGAVDVWYASPMRKILKDADAPTQTRTEISISCAKNESEAMQIVVSPKASGQINSVSATLIGPDSATLGSDQFDICQAKYVPIANPSPCGLYAAFSSRSEFTGYLPDPLPEFEAVSFNAGDTNILIWLDVTVPDTAPAGVYNGTVTLGTNSGDINIPVELTVWDFALPDRPTFRSSMQLIRHNHYFLFPFHKVTSAADKYDLAQAYIAELARYKLSVAYPAAPTMAWGSGNLVEALAWAFNELYLTGVQVLKYSGEAAPPIGVMDMTPEEGLIEGEAFEATAQMLSDNDWLDLSFILIDEPRVPYYDGVRNLVEGFRAQPNAKDARFMVGTYNIQIWDGLRDYIDIVTPVNDERVNYLSPMGAALVPPRSEARSYQVKSSHLWIDAPGITQRMWAPKQRAFGSNGVLVWSILMWWDETIEGHSSYVGYNPWIEPSTLYGNGAQAFFYPPSELGTGLPTKDMTIVPSMRLVLVRDGVEDFEYQEILEQLIEEAEAMGTDTGKAVAAMEKMNRLIVSPTSFRLSEAYWEDARADVAEAIVNLSSAVEITNFEYNSATSTVTISWTTRPDKTYQLYYSDALGAGEQWLPVTGSYTITDGIVTQTTTLSGGTQKKFFKVKVM